MKTNVKVVNSLKAKTHEGAVGTAFTPEKELKRAVLSCLLWEDSFYESGVDIAKRIASLVPKVDPIKVGALAIDARTKYKLRHVPLLLVREMARTEACKPYVAEVLYNVIERADELAEFLAIYWKEKRQPLSAQVKKGLARAFGKFDEYQLAKYNRDGAVKLKDVLFLCHAKPVTKQQEKLWKKLIDDKLETPDTWETNLSAGKDKGETFARLISEKKLGGLAVLRNLRNMQEAKVSKASIIEALKNINTKYILPFRFITASKYAPAYELQLEEKLFECLQNRKPLSGRTIILIDVSGSMDCQISDKSEVNRIDVASGVAIMARELCKDVAVYTFSDRAVEVPARRGFALSEAVKKSQPHNSTYLYEAVNTIKAKDNCDRLIVITDEQSHDAGRLPFKKNYVINVGGYKNGIAYDRNLIRIDGWSEAVLDYVAEYEETLD